jgi:hypothetical protein
MRASLKKLRSIARTYQLKTKDWYTKEYIAGSLWSLYGQSNDHQAHSVHLAVS